MAKSNSRKKWMRAREKCDRKVVGRGGSKYLLLAVPTQVLYLNFTNKLLIKICLFPGPDFSAPAVLFLIQKQKSVYFPMPFFCVLILPSYLLSHIFRGEAPLRQSVSVSSLHFFGKSANAVGTTNL